MGNATLCHTDSLPHLLLKESQLKLSARGYARMLKVARTIEDLEGEPRIGITHIAESIQYREQPRHLS